MRGNYEAHMQLSKKAMAHIDWWIGNIDSVVRSLTPLPVTVTIYSDASKKGWGGDYGLTPCIWAMASDRVV